MFRNPSRSISQKDGCLQIQETEIPFSLKRSHRRKTLAIYVDDRGKVQVYSPSYVTEEAVIDFMREKSEWILKSIQEAHRKRAKIEQRSYDHGHKFLFLGKKFLLIVKQQEVKRSNISFDGFKWTVILPKNLSQSEREKQVKRKLLEWYKMQAIEILGGRIFHYARKMGLEPKKISIRTQKRIWGNCDYNTQTIHLNWQIILSPLNVVDYVVVHELCHLKVPNHSKRFWREVERQLPYYKNEKKWLKINFLEMNLD